jgi:peptidylprolyl isomerase
MKRSGIVGACLALGLAGTARAQVIGKVGSIDVTGEQIRAYVGTLGTQEQEAITKDPALLGQVVRLYLARQAVLREARAKRWDQDPAVKAQLDAVRDQALSELYLQAVSQPPAGYPSEAEVAAAYEARKSAYQVPRQYRLAQIFVAAPRGATAEAEAAARGRLEAVQKKLRAKGSDFAAVAREHTEEDGARARGGEIGWLGEAQMVAGVRAAVLSLQKGATSEPVRLDDGWHLVKLLDVREPAVRSLEDVRDSLTSALRTERSRSLRQAYLTKLLEDDPPAINELELRKVMSVRPK